MDLLIISLFAFIAGIVCWLLNIIESLKNNKLKKKKEVKVSLFDDSFNRLCRLINNKISTTYFPPFSENNVRLPIEYKLSNKITMLSDEEEHKLLEYLKKEYVEQEIRVCNDYDPVTHFPININYVTIIDVEFANNFKGPYTAVILKFK